MPTTIQETSTLLDGVTATTTSQAFPVKGVRKATVFFTRADHSAGSSKFEVSASVDDSTYVTLVDLVSNATATPPTVVADITLASDTTEMAHLDLSKAAYSSIKVTVTETTDGTHTAKICVEYL